MGYDENMAQTEIAVLEHCGRINFAINSITQWSVVASKLNRRNSFVVIGVVSSWNYQFDYTFFDKASIGSTKRMRLNAGWADEDNVTRREDDDVCGIISFATASSKHRLDRLASKAADTETTSLLSIMKFHQHSRILIMYWGMLVVNDANKKLSVYVQKTMP